MSFLRLFMTPNVTLNVLPKHKKRLYLKSIIVHVKQAKKGY